MDMICQYRTQTVFRLMLSARNSHMVVSVTKRMSVSDQYRVLANTQSLGILNKNGKNAHRLGLETMYSV